MKCPHCLQNFAVDRDAMRVTYVDVLPESPRLLPALIHEYWTVLQARCPEPKCSKIVIWCEVDKQTMDENRERTTETTIRNVYPNKCSRPVPSVVPSDLAADFVGACEVLSINEKASAALSRRCLELLLTKYCRIEGKRLENKVDKAITDELFSSNLGEYLHMLREMGNFSLHPIEVSGEIVDVEPQEAELCIQIIEELFDEVFVKPAKRKAIQKKFNDEKVVAANRKPIMTS